MLLRIIVISVLSCPLVSHAQFLPRDFGSLDVGGNAGNALLQLNTSLTQNISLSKRYHRSHILFGVRASYIRVAKDLMFSPARDPEPSFHNQEKSFKIGTFNILLGFNVSITRKLLLGVDAELLGIAFGSGQSGELAYGGKIYTFDAAPLGTNFLLNGTNGGNLFHTLSLGYVYDPSLIFKVGVASQSIIYNYRSNLDGFANFDKISYTTTGFVSVQWIFKSVR